MSEQQNTTKTSMGETEQINVDALMAEYDRESNTRHYAGVPKVVVRFILAAFALYVFYMNLISVWPEQIRRASFVGLIVFMAFMLYPAKKKSVKRVNYVPWYDFLLGIIGAACFFYYVVNFNALAVKATRIGQVDVIIGVIGVLIIAEVCRRVVGLPILVVAAAFVTYAFATGYSINRIIYTLFYTLDGVIGTPIGVCSTFIVLFIILGSFLEKTNIGTFFIDIANSIAGRATGGPAKVAVISSALEGMYSGSSVANTVGSGSVTIPVMKKTGYDKDFAAAVEAAASTGGQIMPPIMGTGAFIMAEFLGIPYISIAAAAIIPAILYFAAVFFQVDLRARKIGLRGLAKEDIPDAKKTILRYGHMFLPIIILVVLLMEGFTPLYAAFYSILVTWILSFLRKETRMGVNKLIPLAVSSARSCLSLSVAMANAGFVVAVLSMTGIGIILADNIVALSQGSLFVTLVLCMVVSIVLGMGLPTSACYIIAATIAVPILAELNVPGLQAHFFVFYFSCLSTVTPPVALASYVAAGMSGAGTNEVGWAAFKLALAGFIVPFFFIYAPAVILIADSAMVIAWAAFTGLIGTALLAVAVEGYLFRNLPWLLRVLFFGGAVLLMAPGLYSDIAGFGIAAVAIAWAVVLKKRGVSGRE